MFETVAQEVRQHFLLPLLRSEPSALLLNPLIVNGFHSVWIQLRYLLEQESDRNYQRKPMSGFFTVMMALQVRAKERSSLRAYSLTASRKDGTYGFIPALEIL
jgi:hypothetical protein